MPQLQPPVGDSDHVQGPADAPHTLVEFGDYQCPYCVQAAQVVAAVRARAGDRFRFVFRNYPLVDMHPHALPAARAAEAATGDAFWKMHDALFANPEALDTAGLKRTAAACGVDASAFDAAQAGAHDAKIEADMKSGEASAIQGTPTFYLDGARLDGWDEQTLLRALNAD